MRHASFPRSSIALIFFLSLVTRVWFALASNHLYYPDEVFQTLEPAFARVSGFGIEAPEQTALIRPAIVPVLLSLPLAFFIEISHGDPWLYGMLMQLLLALWSTTIPIAVYTIVHRSYAKNRHALLYGLGAGILASLWFELIYVSSRALFESLATNMLAGAYLIYIHGQKLKTHLLKKEVLYVVSGALLVLAAIVRPHLFILCPILGIWFVSLQRFSQNRLVFGALVTLFIVGGWEYYQTGYFMGGMLNYLKLQSAAPISTIFGTQPWFYYLMGVLTTSFAVVIPSLTSLKNSASHRWWLALLLFVGSHSLVAHKELRFMLPVVPIILILFGQSLGFWHRYLHKHPMLLPATLTLMGVLFSIASFFSFFPWIKPYYPIPFLYRDPLLRAATALHRDPSVCGVYDDSHLWPQSLSYYLINRRVPLYSQDYPPPHLENISHRITQTGTELSVMVKLPSVCEPDPAYSNKRSSPEFKEF